jgi:hypothetical protein
MGECQVPAPYVIAWSPVAKNARILSRSGIPAPFGSLALGFSPTELVGGVFSFVNADGLAFAKTSNRFRFGFESGVGYGFGFSAASFRDLTTGSVGATMTRYLALDRGSFSFLGTPNGRNVCVVYG